MSKDVNKSGSSNQQRQGSQSGGQQGGRQGGGTTRPTTPSPNRARDQEIGREFTPGQSTRQGNQPQRSQNEQQRREKERNQPQ
jgi:hypothetical protein